MPQVTDPQLNREAGLADVPAILKDLEKQGVHFEGTIKPEDVRLEDVRPDKNIPDLIHKPKEPCLERSDGRGCR